MTPALLRAACCAMTVLLPVAAWAAEMRRLEITLHDLVGLTPATTEQVHREVEEIFASLATDVDWLEPDPARPVPAISTRMRVILMPSVPRAWALEKGVMGVVHRGERGAENVYVFPAAVQSTLGRAAGVGGPKRLPVPPRRLARALGRIIGHEIIHAIAPDHPHAPEGLMRERMNRYLLASPGATIDALCAEAFRASLPPTSSRLWAGSPR